MPRELAQKNIIVFCDRDAFARIRRWRKAAAGICPDRRKATPGNGRWRQERMHFARAPLANLDAARASEAPPDDVNIASISAARMKVTSEVAGLADVTNDAGTPSAQLDGALAVVLSAAYEGDMRRMRASGGMLDIVDPTAAIRHIQQRFGLTAEPTGEVLVGRARRGTDRAPQGPVFPAIRIATAIADLARGVESSAVAPDARP